MIETRSARWFLAIALLGIVAGAPCRATGPPAVFSRVTRARRPVALALGADGSRIYAANRRSGSLSVVDAGLGLVTAEHDLGRGLGDLAALPDGRLLAVDREGDALLILKVDGDRIEVESRLPTPPDPASVLVAPDGASCVVASCASRCLSFFSLATGGRSPAKRSSTAVLPFEPLLMAWAVPGSKLIAADAYGGRLAVVEPGSDAVSIRSIPAHNIRGLANTPDGRSLVVVHQTLNRSARSNFEGVHWGTLLGNQLRVLQLDALLATDPDADPLKGSRVVEIGRQGRAAGDPGPVAFDREGRIFVALTGVHEVALITDLRSYYMRRVAVGQGPTDVLASPDGSVVYVADGFDDSISVVEVATGRKLRTIPLGPSPEPGPVERGEQLFADARLSHDGWMSCQSCHTDGHTNGLSADTLSDGSFGAAKRIPSLLGVGSTAPWSWLGKSDRLEEQVRKSIETTMRGRTPSDAQVDDLTAYLRSLPPPRSTPTEDDESVTRGRQVFRARKCAECHAPPDYTASGSFDVGLLDEAGNREFNPPSLLGVGSRPPFLHDGRAASLFDVFVRHRHPRESGWSYTEVEDLVAFLKTL